MGDYIPYIVFNDSSSFQNNLPYVEDVLVHKHAHFMFFVKQRWTFDHVHNERLIAISFLKNIVHIENEVFFTCSTNEHITTTPSKIMPSMTGKESVKFQNVKAFHHL